jgi:hypothetical protein
VKRAGKAGHGPGRATELVYFRRGIAGAQSVVGYVLAQSSQLVLIHNVEDFHLDGFAVIRVSDIELARSGKYERFLSKVLRKARMSAQLEVAAVVSLRNVGECLTSLKGRLVTVECEDPSVDRFYCGRILRVGKRHVSLRTFDASGRWGKKPESVALVDVTFLAWDTEYLTVFSKYVR